MAIAGPFNSGAAVGGDAVATANTDSTVILSGYVAGIYVRYNDSPPAGTTDIVIATKGTNAPAQTILSISNAASDGWFYPRPQIHTTAGAAIADQYDWLHIDDFVNVKILQANAADSIDVWIDLTED